MNATHINFQGPNGLRDKENCHPANKQLPAQVLGKNNIMLKKKASSIQETFQVKPGGKKETMSQMKTKDVQYVEDFVQPIFQHLRTIELDYVPRADALKRQRDLNEKMREILVDWMQEVCLKFRLLTETYYLAVNLVDRFLSCHQMSRDKFQLLGISALFMAAKYEEIYPPNLKDFLSLCDNAFLKVEMVNLEAKLLSTVDFKLAVPSILKFLERYSHIAELSKKEHYFCCFLLETALLSTNFLEYQPSTMAAAAVYLSGKIFSRTPEWSDVLKKETKLDLEGVRPCAKELFVQLFKSEESKLTATKRKYSTSEFYEVSRFKFDWLK